MRSLPNIRALLFITCLSYYSHSFVLPNKKSCITITIGSRNNFANIPTKQCFGKNMKHNDEEEEQMSNSEASQFLDKASKLRKEAEELEVAMNRGKGKNSGGKTNKEEGKTMINTKLENSNWMISYRFASDPVADDDKEEDSKPVSKPVFYSGKVAIRLTSDGYTELLSPDANDTSSTKSPSLSFLKFWGWDKETSREDGNTYLSFSADVVLPNSDPNYDPKSTASRFYFNSQVETDSKTGEISLNSGTVTVKRDIEPPGGFWGVFNAGGILAQFRYCGEFLIKPTIGDFK